MAARSNKIFRDILFKQYKYNPKIISPIVKNISRSLSQNVPKESHASHRSQSSKAPQNQTYNDSENFLQPSMLPQFVTYSKSFQIQWPQFQPNQISAPFYPNKELKATNFVSPKSKRSSGFFSNDIVKNSVPLQNRHYSTYFTTTRYYSKKGGNQTEDEKCPPDSKKCYKACPKWQLHNCPPQGDNLDCLRPYVEPCCKKKFAPYPSFSETCAERLEDDPSECMQCPWSRCGGAENLKYPKRKYHTASTAQQRFHAKTLPIVRITDTVLPVLNCDARKPPCKRPPGKCDYIKSKEEPCPPLPKGPCPPPFERKKCDREKEKRQAKDKWTDAYKLWVEKNNVVSDNELDAVVTPIIEQTLKLELDKNDDCKGDMVTPDDSCCLKLPFDKKQMDYEQIRKKKCHLPSCKRKKRKMVPDGCEGACGKKCDSIDVSDLVYSFDKKKKKCPGDECIRPKCPDFRITIDDHMDLAKTHDKGHPPPCPSWRKPSKQCPKKEKCKRPYKQEHDLHEPFYKRQKRPWPEIDHGHGEKQPDNIS